MKRVYHPTLDSWQDVPDASVEDWAAAGWRKTKPGHVDTSDAPPVGDAPEPVTVPDVEPEADQKK